MPNGPMSNFSGAETNVSHFAAVVRSLSFVLCFSFFALAWFLVAPNSAPAQQQVAALTNDEHQALQLITERSVTGAIAFLASDEMKGRGTPSPEYRIATAYVAARFKAAGLEPGGDDDSFFHTAELDVVQLPSSGIRCQCGESGQEDVGSFGLLHANDSVFEFSGAVPRAESDTEFSGPVILDYDDEFAGPRGLATLATRIRRLGRQGATAIILPVAEDCELVARAARLSARPQAAGRSRFALPILLVDDARREWANVSLRLPAANKSKTKNSQCDRRAARQRRNAGQ